MRFEYGCGSLEALLSGAFGDLHLIDLDDLRQHWLACDKCQGTMPEAPNHLSFIENELLRHVRVNIETLYHRYRLAEHNLLAGIEGENLSPLESAANFTERSTVEERVGPIQFVKVRPTKQTEPDIETKRLLLLADVGEDVRWQVQAMNDSYGLDTFHLIYDLNEFSSTRFGEFFAGFSIDVQRFVVESILAADSIWQIDSKTVIEMGYRLYELVVKAAPEFVKTCAASHGPLTAVEPDSRLADQDSLRELGQKLEQYLEDMADSLKAGQMEMMRKWNSFGTRASDLEPQIEVCLGPLYSRLSVATKRNLQLAEYHYSYNPEPDDFTASIVDFYRAYEEEFKYRLLLPIETLLQQRGQKVYCDDRYRLLIDGKLNRSLTLGTALHFIQNDPNIYKVVKELGFNADRICERCRQLTKLRNDAVHGKGHSREDAESVRSLLLGQPSILADLFKESGSLLE